MKRFEIILIGMFMSSAVIFGIESLSEAILLEMQYRAVECADANLLSDYIPIDATINKSPELEMLKRLRQLPANIQVPRIGMKVDQGQTIKRRLKHIDAPLLANRMTALMIAAYDGNAEVAEELLRLGADPDVSDVNGLTALDYARSNNHNEMVNLLEAAA